MPRDSNLTDSQFLKAQGVFQRKQKKFFHDCEQKEIHKLKFMKKKLNLWERIAKWIKN